MSKKSKRATPDAMSALKTLQHALGLLGERWDDRIPDSPAVATAYQNVVNDLLRPLENHERIEWIKNVERSLRSGNAPSMAISGWNSAVDMSLARGFEDDNGERWMPFALLVSMPESRFAQHFETPQLDAFQNFAVELSLEWGLGFYGVNVGRDYSEDFGVQETLVDVYFKAVTMILTDEENDFDDDEDDDGAPSLVHTVYPGEGEELDNVEAFDMEDLGPEVGVFGEDPNVEDPDGERSHMVVYLAVQCPPGETLDHEKLLKSVHGRWLTLSVNSEDVAVRVENAGNPVAMSVKVAGLDTLAPFDAFLAEQFENVGRSWANVKAITYPAFDTTMMEGDAVPLEAMDEIHVVLWAEKLKTVVGAFPVEVYADPDVMLEMLNKVNHRLQDAGIAYENHTPQPLEECDGCGTTLFWVPQEGQKGLVLMHSDDDGSFSGDDDEDGEEDAAVAPVSRTLQ